MFLGGMLGGAGFAPIDPTEERDPPPSPTPITFPVYERHAPISWDEPDAVPNFQILFSRILKPDDISDQHAQALNFDVHADCPLQSLVGTSPFHPANPEKLQSDLQDRINELEIETDLALRTLTKTLPKGVKGPRLAWTRKFWSGLESMSPYWDCSLDQYWDTEDEATVDETVKRPRLDPNVGKSDLEGSDDGSPSRVEQTQSDLGGGTTLEEKQSARPTTRRRYKGRRTHSGREMPDAFRAETVRSFVEAAVFPFHCSVSPPRQMPIVVLDRLKLPVRQTAAVYRIPSDAGKARQGRHEGPLIAVQVRADTGFVDDHGNVLAAQGRLDLLREVGGLLQIAQERAREGQEEVRPGESKWWTTVPRWGGGEGGESEDKGGNSDTVQLAESALGLSQKRLGASSKSRKRKTPIAIWKELRCGSTTWDPRTDYKAIGKDPSSAYDHVYMVSSLNHHVSVLRLTVHASYLALLTHGTYPSTEPLAADWSRPVIHRSRWYDLFDSHDRVEIFKGLWNVMAYLNREGLQATP